ncbi:FAD-dependent monooxygenase [Bradyrhizobium sp. AUGA SZCCT0222]|uniref:FAD-dependent monooxygenase n=1 Tax=Bradyrhizobium sp. AUGA SZCCT0222 TaxID=2807668 RepID=UPI001BAD07C3|nr:FAD-dependent monooxygenase [Bradyrhizobium sp. AUGA SZCCT0222]MBR1267669.1 FAD-dependent monooxygenase [Bradyrhizobium sp. AUGA SZCCT0222]
MTNKLQIAIVGAGIGGLTAALALRARGLGVTVFERADSPRELGAGVSIHPNAVRLLKRIGLRDWLENINTRSVGISLRTSRGEPVPTPIATADSTTYQVHRVELLEMLNDAQADAVVRYGHHCTGVRETEDGVRLTFGNGVTARADVVIGADGIHSVVQREIGLTAHPTSEGIMAYRGLVPSEKLSWAKDLRGLNMWMGSGRSFICFPISQGRVINIVAFVPTNLESEESWSAPGDLRALAAEYVGWDAPVVEAIAALDEAFRWGIYDRAPLPYWSTARVTLLGDAAHPVVPHFGQGAGQAIEDGFALAVLLEDAKPADVPVRLKAYEQLRFGHTSRVQAASRDAGRFYRSESEDVAERNRRMGKWMSAAGWIFQYDVEQAAAALL